MAENYINYKRITELSEIDKDVDIREKSMKLSEECGEFQQAILKFVGAKNVSKSADNGDIRENVLEELCDTINIAVDIINTMGFTDEEASAMFEMKLDKWKAKTEKYVN